MQGNTEGKKARMKMSGILLISFLLLYIPSFFHWVYGNDIATQLIRMGTIEDSITTDAYIVRDEEVLKSSAAGKCIFEVNEGDKVSANYRIATVLKGTAESLLEELRKKDAAILKNQMEKSKNQELFSEDLVRIDNEISEKVRAVITESSKNNLSKVKLLRDEIDGLVKKKAEIFGGASTADAYINSLLKDKEKIQAQINQNKYEIVTKSPGIVSFTVDGYEKVLTPSSIWNLTPKAFENIKVKDAVHIENNRAVEPEVPFAKVIKDIKAFMVVILDPQKAGRFKLGDTVDEIRINAIGYSTSGTVEYKSNQEDGKYVLAFGIDKGISETAALRRTNIDIVKNSIKGYKVFRKSLRDADLDKKKARICLVKFNYAKFKEVEILGYDEDFAIIKNIDNGDSSGVSLYDTYVAEPENIQEGQMINK